MTMHATLSYDKLANEIGMTKWESSERSEYCEDICENYTAGKERSLLARVASVFTALFV